MAVTLTSGTVDLELLVTDEPTAHLDVLGQRALARAWSAWPGGLLLASHNSDLVERVGVERKVRLE